MNFHPNNRSKLLYFFTNPSPPCPFFLLNMYIGPKISYPNRVCETNLCLPAKLLHQLMKLGVHAPLSTNEEPCVGSKFRWPRADSLPPGQQPQITGPSTGSENFGPVSTRLNIVVRATSHTSQEPWPWNCESLKEKCPKAVPTHLHNHVVWSRTLQSSVKSYVTGPSIKCYFHEFLFMWVLTHGRIE